MAVKIITLEDKRRLQKDAQIPHLPTDLTYKARMAVCGIGDMGADWLDKPHRVVYDLCREIERLNHANKD